MSDPVGIWRILGRVPARDSWPEAWMMTQRLLQWCSQAGPRAGAQRVEGLVGQRVEKCKHRSYLRHMWSMTWSQWKEGLIRLKSHWDTHSNSHCFSYWPVFYIYLTLQVLQSNYCWVIIKPGEILPGRNWTRTNEIVACAQKSLRDRLLNLQKLWFSHSLKTYLNQSAACWKMLGFLLTIFTRHNMQ